MNEQNPYLSGPNAKVLRSAEVALVSDDVLQRAVNQLRTAVVRLKLEREFHQLFDQWLPLIDRREDH